MAISFQPDKQIFHLTTQNTSYLFHVRDGKFPEGQYYGRRIRDTCLDRLWQVHASGFTPNYDGAPDGFHALDVIAAQCPVYGGGDFHSPAVSVEFQNGSRLLELHYTGYEITEGCSEPQGLPGLNGEGQTLTLTLEDEPTGLQVLLHYAVLEDCDVIARSLTVVNATGAPVRVTRALSVSLDLTTPEGYTMTGLYGAHVRERYVDRTPLRHGTQLVESRRGASGHYHNPFIALSPAGTDENLGEAYGFALIYSGNFIALVQRGTYETSRVQLGIHPTDFTWTLEPGERFATPQAALTFSSRGFNGMSQNLHSAFRRHLGHTEIVGRRRPIVINNWEATYFDFNEEKLLAIIESCKGLGIDTFVLDDGWFGHRDMDTSSLGDWFVDSKKLPRGLTPLIEKCEAQGMSFGLWFEPEMVSEDSQLFRAHPDWAIKQEGRPFCRGRNQLILDLTREDVYAYLLEAVSRILRENRISYVKWDMNRHMTDAFSSALPPHRQPELFHRYMLNLYRLMDALNTAFPHVVFEGCSGGGGRFDAGMLYYQPQIWTSDDSDAIERLKIQYGTSFAYPPETMTAHISASPNHQMGRRTPFSTRAAVAMSASFGYELNPLELSEEERREIANQTARYREISDLVVNGVFYRLISPFDTNLCSWMFVSPSQSKAVAVLVQQQATPMECGRLLKLQGLNPDARYHIEELDMDANGDELMYVGLSIPILHDFDAAVYTLTQI